jgi:hypothetical protein
MAQSTEMQRRYGALFTHKRSEKDEKCASCGLVKDLFRFEVLFTDNRNRNVTQEMFKMRARF